MTNATNPVSPGPGTDSGDGGDGGRISPIVRRSLRRRRLPQKHRFRGPMIIGAGLAVIAVLAAGYYFLSKPKEPSGDVIAIVDGIEITSAIVEAEARIAGTPLVGPDAVSNRNAVLNRAVQRALLVAEANRRKLPRDPDFIIQREIVEQNILADKALAMLVERQPKITDAAVARYQHDNPHMFAQRQAIQVDQIRFKTQAFDPTGLDDLHSLAAVADRLQQQRIPFVRSQQVLDSATLPKGMVEQLALAGGEPAYHSVAGTTYVNVLLAVKLASWPAGEQDAVARRALAANERKRQTERVLQQLQRSARIRYQAGYGPK